MGFRVVHSKRLQSNESQLTTHSEKITLGTYFNVKEFSNKVSQRGILVPRKFLHKLVTKKDLALLCDMFHVVSDAKNVYRSCERILEPEGRLSFGKDN